MLLDDLLTRRVVVLSGKGGVGKSVVGLALALAARDRGKSVLLVEIEAPLEAGRHLGLGAVGPRVREVEPGLALVNLDPDTVMHEYIVETVKLEALARRVIDSPVYQRFYSAAPGLPELMMLGKIMVLSEERLGRGNAFRYDLVILDAPATGHGLAFLRVPQAASTAIPIGPIGNNARRIMALLRDPQKTALVVVAIPEEMAVVEGIELFRLAREEAKVEPVGVILNRCEERRFTAAQEKDVLDLTATDAHGPIDEGIELRAAVAAARRQIRRRKLTVFYEKRLRKALPVPVVCLPQILDGQLSRSAIESLAARIEGAA